MAREPARAGRVQAAAVQPPVTSRPAPAADGSWGLRAGPPGHGARAEREGPNPDQGAPRSARARLAGGLVFRAVHGRHARLARHAARQLLVRGLERLAVAAPARRPRPAAPLSLTGYPRRLKPARLLEADELGARQSGAHDGAPHSQHDMGDRVRVPFRNPTLPYHAAGTLGRARARRTRPGRDRRSSPPRHGMLRR